MAISNIDNVDYFPLWKPQNNTLISILDGLDRGKAFKLFRSSCSAFISNINVRSVIMKKNNYKCTQCSSYNNLEIDHIISVLDNFKNNTFYDCNTYENLQVLCKKCNTSKKP